MKKGEVVDLTDTIALEAAAKTVERKIPMADRILLATTYLHAGTLWTEDSNFTGLENV